MSVKSYTYLALGDSYTIGESVAPDENFPNQTSALMRRAGFDFSGPEIIAKTSWTTTELKGAIDRHQLKSIYDFVSLLIGVNNQYRGLAVEEYKIEFETLLKLAIKYSGNKPENVLVISIPDWGITPFAKGRDRISIAYEINEFNNANKQIALKYNVGYIDITPWTREAASDVSLLAKDGLHPSGKEYRRWAEKIAAFFKENLASK